MTTGTRALLASFAAAMVVSTAAFAAPAPAKGTTGTAPGTTGTTGANTGTAAPRTAPALPGVAGTFTPPPPIRPGQPLSVMVFPFGFGTDADTQPKPMTADATGAVAAPAGLTSTQQDVSAWITSGVKAGLLATPAFQVYTYSKQSSLIQRAEKDTVITPAQHTDVVSAINGAVDIDKARVLANRLGIQTFLTGNLEMKNTPTNVEITGEVQLINSSTGEVIGTAAVSGSSAVGPGEVAQLAQQRASRDVAQKTLSALGIQLVAAAPPPPPPAAVPAGKRGAKPAKAKKTEAAPKARPASDSKAARDAKKQQEREAKAARDQQKAAEKEAKKAADAEAKKAAEQKKQSSAKDKQASTKPDEQSRREQERAAKARKDEEKKLASQSGKRGSAKTAAAAGDEKPVRVASADPKDVPAVPAPAPAAPGQPTTTPAVGNGIPPLATPGTSNLPAVADTNGDPVPFGYALDTNKAVLPTRDRKSIRVPAWLGVAAFLTGVSFLL